MSSSLLCEGSAGDGSKEQIHCCSIKAACWPVQKAQTSLPNGVRRRGRQKIIGPWKEGLFFRAWLGVKSWIKIGKKKKIKVAYRNRVCLLNDIPNKDVKKQLAKKAEKAAQ